MQAINSIDIRLGLIFAYSFLYGVHRPGELVGRAASYGTGVVSVCDLNNLYGVHTFLEAAKEHGLRPVIGAVLMAPLSGWFTAL
jgi:DNA polymerase III alpha subunit